MGEMYSEVQKLRRELKPFGLGLHCKLNPATGEYGFIVVDLTRNACIGGGNPIPYSWDADDVRACIAALRS